MNLMTSDEYPAYREMILAVYGQTITPQPTGRPGRPRAPYQQPPPELLYATVHKEREGNRVVRVDTRLIFGTVVALAAALVLTPGTRGAAPQVIEVMKRHLLVPEIGKPEDIAALVCFLASRESRYINGQTYIADGGMLAHNPTMADLVDFASRRP